MLYIVTPEGHEYTWHVGDPKPLVPGEIVHLIQADGDERELIRTALNIPFPQIAKAVVIWRAPWAQWIYDNVL